MTILSWSPGEGRVMWIFSLRMRREARSRAPDYAAYFVRMHGAEAGARLEARIKQQKRGTYHWLLYRLALREVRLIEQAQKRRRGR